MAAASPPRPSASGGARSPCPPRAGRPPSLTLALALALTLTVTLGRSTAVARFSFTELCGRPLGAADYLGIAAAFHTVFITDIPRFTLNDINQVVHYV